MRPFFLWVLGWTSASISTCWCCEETWTRPGRCGGQCSRWLTWELTQPPPCYNPWTCLRSEECPVARPHVSDVIGVGTRRAVLAQDGGTVAATWDRYHATPEERLDLVALQMYGSGRLLEDFVPANVAALSDRLAAGLDGISQSYFFAQWRLWQWGAGRSGLLHARGAECQE